jgi:hypothetical protein
VAGSQLNDDELERILKEAVMAYSQYYPGICSDSVVGIAAD